jgi:hypothetical protein
VLVVNETRGSPPGWLDLIAVFWLLFVAGAYLLLAYFQPATSNNLASSPFDRLDAPSLALLACLLLAGIMRYGSERRRVPGATPTAGPEPPAPEDEGAGVEP